MSYSTQSKHFTKRGIIMKKPNKSPETTQDLIIAIAIIAVIAALAVFIRLHFNIPNHHFPPIVRK